MRRYKVGEIWISVPAGHHETPWAMHKAVRKAAEANNDSAIIEAITGASLEDFEGAQQFGILDAIASDFAQWFAKPMNKDEYSYNGIIRHNGGAISIPNEVQGMQAAQFMDAKATMSNADLSELDRYESVFKIIAYPAITGEKYNAKKAQAMDIGGVLFPDVVLAVDFFLTVYANSRSGTNPSAAKSNQQPKSDKQTLKQSASSSAILPGFYRWRAAVSGSLRRFWNRLSTLFTARSSTTRRGRQQNADTPT